MVIGLMRERSPLRVLGVSGSLRQSSSNGALLAATARLAPEHVAFSIYRNLGQLPPFNPDQDTDDVPASVTDFRTALRECDAVLLSSPEYAHGVPGVLKNALDWVVGSGELIDKPVALVNASSRAIHAWRSLAETLTTMSARLVREASLTIPLAGRKLDADGIANDGHLSAALRSAIDSLIAAVRERESAPATLADTTLRAVRADEDRTAFLPLLTLADGSERQVRAYAEKGTLYTYWLPGFRGAVGAILAVPDTSGNVELKAVAIVETLQRRGFGSRMLGAVIDELRRGGAKRLIVGTASSGTRELGFYQRAGFRLWRIDRDFFSIDKGYPAGLSENGIPVRDMVWMDQDLT